MHNPEALQKLRILYLTWDGPGVHYLEGLFLPIFERLSEKYQAEVYILQVTWGQEIRIPVSTKLDLKKSYRAIRLTNFCGNLGRLITVFLFALQIFVTVKRNRINTLVARSTLPSFSALIASRFLGRGVSLVYDADGFAMDEKVDFYGLSPSSLAYRVLRDLESEMARRSGAIITRTTESVDIIRARAGPGLPLDKFFVTANGRNPDIFSPGTAMSRAETRRKMGVDSKTVLLVYVGSLGPQYQLDRMLDILDYLQRDRLNVRFLFITQALDSLKNELARRDTDPNAIIALSMKPNQVPEYLASADLGISFRTDTFSMLGVSPIKVGEYLLCGVPVLSYDNYYEDNIKNVYTGFSLDREKLVKRDLGALTRWIDSTLIPERERFRIDSNKLGKRRFSLDATEFVYSNAISYARSIDQEATENGLF